ncbi:helix-turn-helix transcriptional regulator [Tritonibacter mobilis]|nr:helix-turn-helix transcriptional regulator [Tritonibacter mobilis]
MVNGTAEKLPPKHPIAIALHARLEDGRKQKGIQLTAFVEKIGCSANTYRNWRDGKTHPDRGFAIRALMLIGCSEGESERVLRQLHEHFDEDYLPYDGRRKTGKRPQVLDLFETFPRELHTSFGPAALLDARFGIAPFVAPLHEEEELDAWVTRPDPFLLRLEYGPGGVGKTRRWLEYCHGRRNKGLFGVIARRSAHKTLEKGFEAEAASQNLRIVVIDYAESQLDLVAALIGASLRFKNGKTRIILLARNAAGWWHRLKRHDATFQEVLHPGTVSEVRASTMSIPPDRREEAFSGAVAAYAEKLGMAPPRLENEAPAFQSALDLQMGALSAVLDIQNQDLVASVLGRERRFWDSMATDKTSASMIEALAAGTYQVDGVDTAEEAEDMFLRKGFFQDLPVHELKMLFDHYRSLYPGQQYLNPIQPDLIGERLLEEQDAW